MNEPGFWTGDFGDKGRECKACMEVVGVGCLAEAGGCHATCSCTWASSGIVAHPNSTQFSC